MKNKLKKVLGLLLSVALIGNSVDAFALTAHAKGSAATIVAFEELAENVREQTVYVGQNEENIIFPTALNVTVEKTITVQKEVERRIPVETVVQADAGSVSGNDASVSGNDVSDKEGTTVVTEMLVTELVEETKVIEEIAKVEVLNWKIDVANSTSDSFIADDSSWGNVYTYVPELQLADGKGNVFVIADGVVLPEIRVRIAPAINMAGEASFAVNYYVEAEPSDPRAIAFTNPKNPSEIKYFLHMEQLVVNYSEGKVVRGAYSADTGAQMVTDVATNTEISSTKRNYDYAEIAHDYNNVTGTLVNGGEGTVTADGSLTFNCFWKTATYSENYYIKAADGESYGAGYVYADGVLYKLLKSNEVKITALNGGTTVTITDLSGTEEFKGYQLVTPQPSSFPASGSANSGLVLAQFYEERATASYKEQYYVEDETATEQYIKVNVGGELKTYRLHHENIVENAYVGTIATITDLSHTPAFSGYTLVDRTDHSYFESRAVQENDATIVYQFYDKNPTCNYSVVYYVEVYEEQRDGSNITVNVNGQDKYYNRIPDSAYNMACQAPEGTIITIADKSSDIPGVYAGGVKVSDTFKAYTSTLRKYSYDTTMEYGKLTGAVVDGKYTGIVAADGSLQIVLFYDWIATPPTKVKYTEKYYAELADQNVTYGYELIDGVKYELLGEYEKSVNKAPGEMVGAKIEDISWQEPYKTDYELMPATDDYPSRVDNVAEDNSTVLYQIYRLHPQYMISYYKESENGAVTVGDKKYSMENYLIKRMPKGTTISYLELVDGAAAAVGGVAIDGTTKSYDGYEFSAEATLQRGKGTFTVTRGADNSIELFFDKIVPTTTYMEKYYVELEDQSTTTFDIEVGTVKYKLQESNTQTIEKGLGAWITDKSTESPYSGYELLDATPEYPSEVAIVAEDNTTVLYQFYRLHPQCKIQYYIETETGTSGAVIGANGKNYSDDGYQIIRIPVGTDITYMELANGGAAAAADGMEIAGTAKAYDGYEFSAESTEQEGCYSFEVTRGEANLLMLLFDYEVVNADYTIRYYKEASADTTGAVLIDDTYYELAETVNAENVVGTQVAVMERQDGTVGVTENSVEKADSFKSYANYVFNADRTRQNNKMSVILSESGENIIELFFDKARTATYRGEYYVEIEDQSTTDYDKLIDGVKYELKESYTVAGVAYDARVEIADKSAAYEALGYVLMSETSEYPSWVSDVDDNGATVLYQIYRLCPKYTVYYYTEAEKETAGAVLMGDRYYLLQVDDTLVKNPAEGTIVTYAVNGNGEAGVAEDGAGLSESLRSYEGYVFSEAMTIANGKNAGTLAIGNKVVIELFFDRIRADYKEVYWVESPDAVDGYVSIKIDGELKKFVVAKTNIVEDAWIMSKVVISDITDQFVSYEQVYEAVPGYSSVSYGINADDTTEIHQFFVLKGTNPHNPKDNDGDTNVPQPPIVEKRIGDSAVAPKTGEKSNGLWGVILSSLGGVLIALAKLMRKKQ